MKTNVAPKKFTHEGAKTKNISKEAELRRTVMCCLLWEDSFYEDGVSVAQRISDLVKVLPAEVVAKIALEAREIMKLRHVPLLLCRELARNRKLRAEYLAAVIQRPDEISEFLSLYWKDGKVPIAKQVKRGLSLAFNKFNEYELGKYKNGAIKLRDVMFMVHPKPTNNNQELFKALATDTLKVPDTWEVALSGGANKKETFTRLINENKLGGLALLRNLRNMVESGVDRAVVIKALGSMKTDRILPFRFIAAAKYAPTYQAPIEDSMLKCLETHPKLLGTTVIVVDNSGSMNSAVSSKSDLSRRDAACALAILIREICQDPVVISFGGSAKEVEPLRGFALRDAIIRGPGGATNTDQALNLAAQTKYDRIIVISDEQSSTKLPDPTADKAYFINVASYQNGVGYGKWTHIDGWSESIISFILNSEAN